MTDNEKAIDIVAQIMVHYDIDFDWFIVDKMNEEVLKAVKA